MENLLAELTVISYVSFHWRDFPINVPRTFRACAAEMCEFGWDRTVMKGAFRLEKYPLGCFSSGVGRISVGLDG